MTAMDAGTREHEIARRFAGSGEVVEVTPLRRGHIHSSFVVDVGGGKDVSRLLLQRINASVFPDPEGVIRNARQITAHLRRGMRRRGLDDLGRRVLDPVVSDGGGDHVRDGDGGWWRAFHFIDGAAPAGAVDSEHVEAAARAYGQFQVLMADYDGPRLVLTIPGFHDTPRRLEALESAAADDPVGRLAEARREVEGILDRKDLGRALVDADLPRRLVHNDAKLDNVLFDTATGEALCVVDLDTVMPGVVGHDFGDMVRSMSTLTPEDAAGGEPVEVSEGLFAALARGYLEAAGGMLNRAEIESLVPSGMVSTMEQAARFLTDHLEGDVYFRVHRPGQNLDRARTQLALLEALIDARPRLEEIVARELQS
jgi:Ser/Thr protein kinase RdoA (MazF antagonist)